MSDIVPWADARMARLESQPDAPLRRAAEGLLQDNHVVDRLLGDLQRLGLVGERDAALTLYLAALSRKTEGPLHVAVKSGTSAGKNALIRAVSELFPADAFIWATKATRASLAYAGDVLREKVLVLDEDAGGEEVEYALRVAMTEGRVSTLRPSPTSGGGLRAEVTEADFSRTAIFTTSTKAALFEENENRFVEVTLDESSEQTSRIVEEQARRAANVGIADADLEGVRDLWREADRLIEPLRVRNPGALEFARTFPAGWVRARRDFRKVLKLAEMSALLHQRLRLRQNDVVEAEAADNDLARRLAHHLWHRLSPRQEQLRRRLAAAFAKDFSTTDAARQLGYTGDATARVLKDLADVGAVERVMPRSGNVAAVWRVIHDL